MLMAHHGILLPIARYDYEGVASEGANKMMDYLRSGPAQAGDDMGFGFKLEG